MQNGQAAVSDPAIFFSAYFLRDCCDSICQERIKALGQADAFIQTHSLLPYGPESRPYVRARDIDLPAVAKSASPFEVLLQCHSEYPKSPSGTYYECLIYAYHDALILQVMITKFQDWKGRFLEGWKELTSTLASSFREETFAEAQDATLGISAAYWAIANSGSELGAQEEPFGAIAQEQELNQTATDLGAPLWHCDRPLFPSCRGISQDLWMLVTPRSAEPHVNARFYQPRRTGPPDFAIAALARHKISYERTEYLREREVAKRVQEDLERRVRRIVNMQRCLGAELEELRSDHAVEFQRELAGAGAVLADYGQSVGILAALRRTVAVNQRNFLINSVALISKAGAGEVARSIDQEGAAARLLARTHPEEIFAREASTFQGLCQQLESDIDYGNSLTKRHAATLGSARDQLRIAGERELGEIAHHLSIDSAAVVASVVAVIVTEMVLKAEGAIGEPIARWSLALALVVGSFAVTQVLSSGCRGKNLERWSVALAAGLLGVFLANQFFSAEYFGFLARFRLHHVHELVALAAGMLAGWFSHRGLKEYRSRAVRRRAAIVE